MLNVVVPADVEAGSFLEVTVPSTVPVEATSTTTPRPIDVASVNATACTVSVQGEREEGREVEEEDEYFYAEYKITKAAVGMSRKFRALIVGLALD